jgi:hypothetical protein
MNVKSVIGVLNSQFFSLHLANRKVFPERNPRRWTEFSMPYLGTFCSRISQCVRYKRWNNVVISHFHTIPLFEINYLMDLKDISYFPRSSRASRVQVFPSIRASPAVLSPTWNIINQCMSLRWIADYYLLTWLQARSILVFVTVWKCLTSMCGRRRGDGAVKISLPVFLPVSEIFIYHTRSFYSIRHVVLFETNESLLLELHILIQ